MRLYHVRMILPVVAALAGCTDRAATGPSPAAAPTARAPANAPTMTGRWMLNSAGGTCAMTFGGTPEAGEGTIAPEGGCPGNFFTSRKWVFEGDALVLRDHKGQALAQLRIAGDRFDGQATGGQPASLMR